MRVAPLAAALSLPLGVATAAASAAAPPPDVVPALHLAGELVVAPESTTRYDRDLFDYGVDADGDGCDTRREVLIQESLTPPAVSPSCSVRGTWLSAYDGVIHTHAGAVEVDHLVAMSEAWDSGADTWDEQRLRAFGNDVDLPGALNLTTTLVNQQKQDDDIAQWMPPLPAARCQYAVDWVQVEHRWSLAVDVAEAHALTEQLRACGDPPVEVPARP